ncbi:MAG: hypothetical protein EA411_03115 [Saprospirales bacterium]|nr:MAG: hypothetical protein EA411_03115 [Saprospirales bacterium]
MSKKKINNWDELQKARAEARLDAEVSLGYIRKSGGKLKENVNDFAGIAKLIRSLGSFSRSRKSSERGSSASESGTGGQHLVFMVLHQLSRKEPNWRPVIFTILIWLLQSGYLAQVASMKKSDVYRLLLKVVRSLRKKLNPEKH